VVVGGADASQEVVDGGDCGIGAPEVAGVKGVYGDGAVCVGAGGVGDSVVQRVVMTGVPPVADC
jgi:hypothetical protein